jgi:hypothetical protein
MGSDLTIYYNKIVICKFNHILHITGFFVVVVKGPSADAVDAPQP